MKTATQMYHLKRLGLLCGTAARRRASWKVFQASYALGPALSVDGDPGPATTAAIKVSARHGYRVAPHFSLKEFRCKCNGRYHHRARVHVTRDLLLALEAARTKNYPNGLTIVTGWRCRRYNALVGGINQSAHLTGQAADIPRQASPNAFLRLGFHGIGYRSHGLVTHVDVSPLLRRDTAFKE